MVAYQSHCSNLGKILPLRGHAMMLALSAHCARTVFGRAVLLTDKWSAPLLSWLPYNEVRVCIDKGFLLNQSPTTGKLRALAEVAEPFIHLDTDCFQHKRLPAHIRSSPAFCLAIVVTDA